nr:hypothetical protein [Tanacetum cinerariifolium]
MSLRITTQSAGWPAAASRGGGIGGQAGIRGGRTRGRFGDQSNGGIGGRGGHVGGQGSMVNDSVDRDNDSINDNTSGDVRNVIADNDHRGCTYKEFLAFNPKEYDGREAAVGMSWEDFKTLTREELCSSNEMQKLETELWNHAMVEAGHAAYIDRYVYGLALQIQEMVAPMEPNAIQKAMQIAGTLTNEALRNGSIKKNPEKRGNVGEPSKDRNVRDDNKRTRTRNAFAITTNPVGNRHGTQVYHIVVPRNVNPVNVRNLTAAHGACFECESLDHYKSASPKLIRAQGPGGNRPNQALANDEG